MDLDLFSAFDQPVRSRPASLSNEQPIKKPRPSTENSLASVAPSPIIPTPPTSTIPKAPAKTYPFVLDTFQADAIGYIEKNESVLVAAHTSAGKTAVAEYAIAKSLRDGQKVIYTSPIKALSNQKYRDIQEEFNDVGLMTGDMTINPGATCLIMTTEILRSMLYRGSEVIREVAWVIFDEVHYMRDKERGVVWEESIILLPHKVRFVFLSATIPNAKEFVNWVSHLHHQPCHVVYTDYRPVPLQHYIFPTGAEGLFLVVDEKGKFREDSFQKAMSSLQTPPELEQKPGKKQKKPTAKGSSSDLFKIVRLIMEKELDPCIVFSFSKKDCETYAQQMSKLDFNNEDERSLVDQVFNNAIEALSDDDKELPQILSILPMLKRGVGIHHGGLLPILKEVIEILFQEGLIKCLFATETFSIGINMPAKTVVFTGTRKYDGKDFRWITSGEYIQMSGRAGRRGKDDSGIVIQMIDEKIEPDICKGMIYGASDPLFSSYHVSYNMVLNMLRVEDANPEAVLKSSFHQFQQEKQAPELEQQADELVREAQLIVIDNEVEVADLFAMRKLRDKLMADSLMFVQRPEVCVPFMQPGRLLYIVSGGVVWGWGALIQLKKPNAAGSVGGDTAPIIGVEAGKATDYILDVLLCVSLVGNNETAPVFDLPYKPDTAGEMLAIRVSLKAIEKISAIKMNLPKDLNREVNRRSVLKSINDVEARFHGKLPLLSPFTDMGITDAAFKEVHERLEAIEQKIQSLPIASSAEGKKRLADYEARLVLLEKASVIRQQARESQAVAMKDELRRMKRVLKRLAYITDKGVLELKGRFCCEITTADEIVLTDMIFDGIFNELSPEQCVGLLSCFVHKEPSKDTNPKVRGDLDASFRKLKEIARAVAKVSVDVKMAIEEEEYVNSFNPAMMDVAYTWAGGAKFIDICRLTDIFEGSIIRTLKRLEELMRQLSSAALAIGNNELKEKFEQGADKIRRGVVFAASLYL